MPKSKVKTDQEESMSSVVEEQTPVVKKTRTKKAVAAAVPEPIAVSEEVSVAPKTPKTVKPKTTRSRKTATVAASIDVAMAAEIVPVPVSTDDTGAAIPARTEHVILQLQVPSQDLAIAEAQQSFENTFYKYDSILSTPNAFDEYNPFDSQPCMVSDESYQTSQQQDVMETPPPTTTVKPTVASKRKEAAAASIPKTFDHMRDFMQRDEWPMSTQIVCFWCCHSFHTVPYGVPTKYVNEKFYVSGCFCSLECAAASVFYSHEIKHDIWDSYHLLNILARKMGYKASVKVAPPRTCLKMFGGYMDIADFRHHSETYKVIHSHTYPMVATIHQLEEVNDHENYSHRKSMYVPVDRQKLYMLENKIRLERSKPLFNSKNTLDYSMNLRLEN